MIDGCIPGCVAEADTTIFMVETEARGELDTRELPAEAASAARWCADASDHPVSVGSKPRRYLRVRDAGFVECMALDQAIAAYARMLATADAELAARREILEFLELDSAEEAELTDEVRIVLVSADLSTELTTSAIWLAAGRRPSGTGPSFRTAC